MKIILVLSMMFALAACNGKGGSFGGLEETPDDGTETVEAAVEIQSFTPTADPVIVVAAASTTFAVSVNSGAGTVTYEFTLDGTTVLQTSTSPFYSLAGTSLSAGLHTLKVKASNSVSSDEKTFNIRKNRAPNALSSTPGFSGNTVNCDDGTLTFNALTSDGDSDSYTQTWILDGSTVTSSTTGTVITNTVSSAQLAYTPACSVAGFHTLVLRLSDGYETTDLTWSIAVANPAVETIIGYYPTSNNITYLSTKVSDLFNAQGSGVGTLTFTWKLDGTTVHTSNTGTTSNFTLLASAMSIGTHTLTVTLTDGSSTNDPGTPASRSWTVYKNQKPRIISISPSNAVDINLNSPRSLTATVEDALDTFTTTITKGSLDCVPASECGLSGVSLPTTTNSFAATFTSGTSFLGENTFTLKVVDSYGEQEVHEYTVTANYFSDACNGLNAGEICTLIGLPGLGSGTNVQTNANKVRVAPSRLIQDHRGNFFFSDHNTNTVWYYNKSASQVDLLNVQVPAHTLYIVAGTGIAGSGGNGQLARKTAMNFGTWGGGLAWDSGREELFITDYTNSRVLKVDATGRSYVVCGGSNLTTQGALAKNSLCTNPVDVAFDTTNRRLYISQHGNHVLKVIDASNADFNLWPSYILVGVNGSAGYVDNDTNVTSLSPFTTQANTSARVINPWGLYLDSVDQILYFTEYGSCRIRAVGLPGVATARTVGGQNITAGKLVSITQPGVSAAACGTMGAGVNGNALTTNLFNRPMDLVVHRTGAGVQGIYVTDSNHRVSYINNSGSQVTIGGQTIDNLKANNVFGNGQANAPTNPPSGKTQSLNFPMGLVLDGNTLTVAARGSNILRSLDIASGLMVNVLGGTGRAGYSGNAAVDSALVTTNGPLSLLFKEEGGTALDPIPGNMLFLNDLSNFMIRSINLSNGRVEDFIGTGTAGNETLFNTVTTATRITSARSMAIYDGFFLYNDSNNNCFTRAYNPFTGDETLFDSLINLTKTNSILGTVNSCGNFVGTTPLTTTDPNAKLNNPWGIGTDTVHNKIYIASYTSHCILEAKDNGTIKPIIGTCGTVAPAPVYGGVHDEASMLLRFPTEIVMDPMAGNEGNFFFTDWTDQGTAHVKYVNLTNTSDVEFFGGAVNVSHNNVETVLALSASPGFIRTIAAYSEWICYGSGSGTSGNNTIYCRNRTTGDAKTFGVAGIGGIQLETEHEGASVTSGASTVTFAVPSGLAFDADGNLYVSEQGAHVIRKIKRWF